LEPERKNISTSTQSSKKNDGMMINNTDGPDPDGIISRISRSSLNRAFGRGVKMRLRPADFKHHFRFEAMCLILE